mgnify:CR=1 FL=1|jgi:hypothetical protein
MQMIKIQIIRFLKELIFFDEILKSFRTIKKEINKNINVQDFLLINL